MPILSLPPIPLDRNIFPTGKAETVIGVLLLFDKVVPGKYQQMIEAFEATFNQAVTVKTDLQFQ